MKIKHLLRRTATTLCLILLTAVTAWADSYPEYITDLIVVGGTAAETNTAKKKYEGLGYTFITKDLNAGAGGDYIYLGYKKGSSANTNGGYITDLYIKSTKGWDETITYNGKKYLPCPWDGGSHFSGVHGDLNSHNSKGADIHLYYTRENFNDKRAVSELVIDANSKKDGYVNVGAQGAITASYDLNTGCGSSSDDIYLHFMKATKTNRPESTPEFYTNLVFNGSAQQVVKKNPTQYCTMYYKVDNGSWTSTTSNMTATTAGTHTIYYYAGANTYGDKGETHSQTISIGKVTNNSYTTTPAAKTGLVYNNSDQELVSAGMAKFGSVLYKLGSNGTYSSSVPKATAAGTYTVYYKVEDSGNYYGIAEKSVTVTISKVSNNGLEVSIAAIVDGAANVNPSLTGNNLSSGTVTYKYATSANGTYTTTKPTTPGSYYVKATIAADKNCYEYTTDYKSFTVNWSGAGTSSNPYLIQNEADMNTLATRVNSGNSYEGKYFKLGADITYDKDAENNYTAIGKDNYPFKGTFDGNGKTISGININRPYTEYQGIFGVINKEATVKNVNLDNTTILGNKCTAGIAGLSEGTVSGCTVSSSVHFQATSRISYFHAGIVGLNRGTVTNCISSVRITATSDVRTYYGGIVGSNPEGGTVSNCFAINAKVRASTYGGAIAGVSSGTLSNNYYYNCNLNGCNFATVNKDNGAVPVYTLTLGDGISTSATPNYTYNGTKYYAYGATITLNYTVPEGSAFNGYTVNGKAIEGDSFTMPSTDVTVSISVDESWGQPDGADGTRNNPYLIATKEDLDLLAQRVNEGFNTNDKYFKLVADIAYDKNVENNFTTIGNEANYFSGKLDGNGKTISGININKPEEGNLGLFGLMYMGEVHNLTLTETTICGRYNIGGIAGENSGTIKGCTVTSSVVIKATADESVERIGGITGCNYHGYINNCFSSAQLIAPAKGQFSDFGAIAGRNSEGGLIRDCFVFDAVVPQTQNSAYGAITGGNIANLSNNYYTNCTVAGKSNASGVGCNNEDVTEENGAVAVYPVTPKNGLKVYNSTVTYNDINYFVEGQRVMLNYDGSIFEGHEGEILTIEADVEGIDFAMEINNSVFFTMPSQPVSVSIAWKVKGPYVIDLTDNTSKTLTQSIDYSYMMGYIQAQHISTGEIVPLMDLEFMMDDKVQNYVLLFDFNLDGKTDMQMSISEDGKQTVSRADGAKELSNNFFYEHEGLSNNERALYNGYMFLFGEKNEVIDLETFLVPLAEKSIANEYLIYNLAKSKKTGSIVLQDRKFSKDGNWTTLCLPFEVDLTDKNCPLYGAIARTLASASLEGETLRLTVGDPAEKLEAGVPYFIKWSKNTESTEGAEGTEVIINPVFRNVVITDGYNSFQNEYITFRGMYDKVDIDANDKTALFLNDNKLCHADEMKTNYLGGCHALFYLNENADYSKISNVILDFGEGGNVGINNVSVQKDENGNLWFTLDGQLSTTQPVQKGLYINNNKKVLTK